MLLETLYVCMAELQELMRAYVKRCAAAGDSPRIGEFATVLDMNERTLRRHFLETYGQTPSCLMRNIQIELADELLGAELTTRQVACRAGFGSRRSFFRAFRRARGRSPRG